MMDGRVTGISHGHIIEVDNGWAHGRTTAQAIAIQSITRNKASDISRTCAGRPINESLKGSCPIDVPALQSILFRII